MRVELRQLEMIEAVARLGTLKLAAEALFVTQPAISMQIHKLETLLGVALFERVGRNVELTEGGRRALHHAKRVLCSIEDLNDEMAQFKSVDRGLLRLAVVSTASYFVSDYISRFRSLYPQVEVNLRVANRDELLNLLAEKESDIAITGQPPEHSDLVARPFKENPLVVIAPPLHPLCGQATLVPEDLTAFPFVVREPGSGTRAAMERAFLEFGLEVKVACVMSTNEAVKLAVQAGLGLAVISRQTTDLEVQAGRLVELPGIGLSLMRQWYVVYRNVRRLPPVAREFRHLLLPAASARA